MLYLYSSPEILFKSKESNVLAFLAGYIFGDGTYDKAGGNFVAGTVSKELAIQIQLLAAKIGVFVAIGGHRKKGHMIENRHIPDTMYYRMTFPRLFSEKIFCSEFINRFKAIYKIDVPYPPYRQTRHENRDIITKDIKIK